ncbi:MAG: YHYH protein [Chitinophagaceae bacterium]|nr:YHYH protein [Chitinophagaceae bacterium]
MKTFSLFVTCCLLGLFLHAHTIEHEGTALRHWSVEKEHRFIEGSFFMYKNGDVLIEDAHHKILHIPLASLSQKDQAYVLNKQEWVAEINHQHSMPSAHLVAHQPMFDYKLLLAFVILVLFGSYVYMYADKQKMNYLKPVFSAGVLMMLFSFGEKVARHYRSITNPVSIDSAFTPFKPSVHTLWDANYFYVESKGIPTTHPMMVGISNHGWQQQVPIPQCYIGTNAWSIPLNPVIAATPVPVSPSHFTRGAIAIAVNGVAIFNPYTNTGVDALVDGQLDSYGGHCGRGDDYHYHIAPLSLYAYTSPTLPIAYGLDGFAVYGSVEPDGSAMTTLDANHGHFGSNGVYHYHGTPNFPYMIANMVGQVTEDASFQIIPQAAAQPVRPALTPLNGALITSCIPNATNNGYTLSYTLNGQNYSVAYSWTVSGVYTFNFISPTGTTTSTYNGFKPCDVPTLLHDISELESTVSIYPNPANDYLNISLGGENHERDVQQITISSLAGQKVFECTKFANQISVKDFPHGQYTVRIKRSNDVITRKIIIR